MSAKNIGKQIASMRKERGIKQDELASYVGVSTQAVSKWENGGVPDTELLPGIADFFGVPVDRLFGRTLTCDSAIQSALVDRIADMPAEKRVEQIFDFCWDMERALVSGERKAEGGDVKEFCESIGENAQHYSCYLSDSGFTRMGIGNLSQYFLIVPEAKDKGAAYLDGIDYPALFRDFADKAVFDTCVMLNKRENDKFFTPKLLMTKLGLPSEKAIEVINTLSKYEMISKIQIELDDELQEVYRFLPSPSFIALLIFARELIAPPHIHTYRARRRKKPYLE